MAKSEEVTWDLLDRCLLPILFSHALAVIISTVLNVLRISQISTFALFLWFLVISLSAVAFYHNLKVTIAGKGVLVTGCDSRLGYNIARRLDDLGFTVFAGFLNSERSSDLMTRLKEVSSGRLHVLKFDVTSEKDIQDVAEYVKQNLPSGSQGLWAVLNNASWTAFGEVECVPFEVYKQSTDVNLLSLIRISQVFLPLIRNTKGRIINIISILGRIPSPVRSPYCVVKSGVEAFSECLRLEMRRWGVDVIVIEPGDYTCWSSLTKAELLEQARDMWKNMSEEIREKYGEEYFEQRVRTLEQFALEQDADISVTLRSVEDAVTRTFPLFRYTPVTKAEKLQALVSDHLPRSVYDIFYT